MKNEKKMSSVSNIYKKTIFFIDALFQMFDEELNREETDVEKSVSYAMHFYSCRMNICSHRRISFR